MPDQKLFITGGSGYIGSTVIECALQQGYTVTALSRTETSDAKLTKLGATPVRGDLKTHDVLTAEASKADVVINIADSLADGFDKFTPELRFEINNAGIDALAKGLKGSGKPLILTGGSLFSAPDPEGKETDETSPGFPAGHPLASVESRNLAHAKDNIRVMYLRLAPFVFGRGGSGVKIFMTNFAKAGAGLYIDEGKAYITSVHVEDAARLYLLLAEKGRTGEKYNATWETNVTQGQLAKAICKMIDVPCNAVPLEAARENMGQFLAMFLSLENRASNRKAREELGWEIQAKKGILSEVETGSYVAVAEALKKEKNAA